MTTTVITSYSIHYTKLYDVLLQGRVRAVRVRDGRETVLHRSGPGATLGEVPLFDGGDYPATSYNFV